ncbi:MAG: hypothetical protein ACFWTZ_04105 [Burkholderia sp.]|jgi:hypothetical protein
MSHPAPEVYVKYRKWLTPTGKDPVCSWELKPGAPKEAKKLLEEYKNWLQKAREKGILV